MITIRLKQKVLEEATKLKQCATKNELERLDFYNLDPMTASRCVYGQMTRNCFGSRATELLVCCALPYSKGIYRYKRTGAKTFRSENRDYDGSKTIFYSAIEYYICQEYAQNHILIDFLKGVKPTLTIDEL